MFFKTKTNYASIIMLLWEAGGACVLDLDLDFGEGAGKEREKWEIEEREERKMGGEEKKINFYLKVNRFFVEAFCSTPPTYSNWK